VSKIEREQVQTAIQALPAKFREIILLREFEELSYDEIASLLDCPVWYSNVAAGKSALQASRAPYLPEARIIRGESTT
jgi:RNA polymerase sigma-70 factor, ECF subfamily